MTWHDSCWPAPGHACKYESFASGRGSARPGPAAWAWDGQICEYESFSFAFSLGVGRGVGGAKYVHLTPLIFLTEILITLNLSDQITDLTEYTLELRLIELDMSQSVSEWLNHLLSSSSKREKEYSSMLRKAKKDARMRSKVRRVFEWCTRNVSHRNPGFPCAPKDVLAQGYGSSYDIARLIAESLTRAGVAQDDVRIENVLLLERDMGHSVVRYGDLYLCPIYGIRTAYPPHEVQRG